MELNKAINILETRDLELFEIETRVLKNLISWKKIRLKQLKEFSMNVSGKPFGFGLGDGKFAKFEAERRRKQIKTLEELYELQIRNEQEYNL